MTMDVAVIGLGATGSAALHQLARRGLRVVGIEHFMPGHDQRLLARRDPHHPARLFRAPLLRAAAARAPYPLWRQLERDAGTPLLQVTGIRRDRPAGRHAGRRHAALGRAHGLRHEVLDAAEIACAAFRRSGCRRISSACFSPTAASSRPSRRSRRMVALARAAGAEVRTNETVRAIEPTAGRRAHRHRPRRHRGADRHRRRRAMDQAAAARAARAAPRHPRSHRLVRAARRGAVRARALPVFMLESPHGMHLRLSAVPAARVKFAKHHHPTRRSIPDRYTADGRRRRGRAAHGARRTRPGGQRRPRSTRRPASTR